MKPSELFDNSDAHLLRPIFTAWHSKGRRFLAIPSGEDKDECRVIDDAGNNYGCWMSIGSFKKNFLSGNGDPIGSVLKLNIIL